jgi:hypothetical protein
VIACVAPDELARLRGAERLRIAADGSIKAC